MVKPVTSLACCALALSVALPAAADPAAASVVVTTPAVVTTTPATTIVKVTHRHRRATSKKKVLVKVVGHHAEPARSPEIPAAVVVAPVSSKPRREPPMLPARHVHGKGEIVIGPKVDTKVVVTAPVAHKPASVKVVERPAKPSGSVEVTVKPGKQALLSPAAQKAEPEPGAGDASLTVDVGTGDAKVVAAGSGSGPALSKAKTAPKGPCMHDSIEFVRGQEVQSFALTRCDGSPAPLAVERLSVLARPDSAPLPKSIDALSKAKGPDLASGIRRVDPGLVQRIQAIADHFAKGPGSKISIVSGYRPMSSGSYHATAQALDMRLEGIPNEAVVDFCKTLPDTGCGYYPNSSFVHVDVRQAGTGHVAWIDASGPGEPPKYVASWPPPPDPEVKTAEKTEAPATEAPSDRELPPLPGGDAPAAPSVPAVVAAPLEVAK